MTYKLIEGGKVVQAGELIPAMFKEKKVYESRKFFNVPDSFFFEHPTIEFTSYDKRTTTTLEPKRTAKGFAGNQYEYGLNYGVNLNNVKGRATRWGLTVWFEPTEEKAAASL